MQFAFDFGAVAEIERMRERLVRVFGRLVPEAKPEPFSQLVRSIIGSRTRDEVSERAFASLRNRFPDWTDLAKATPGEIAETIAAVTFAEKKADYLSRLFHSFAARNRSLDLAALASLSVEDARLWLEALPGVGTKVAAATLNFSSLAKPAFVVDTHVLRVLQRFGIVGPRSTNHRAYETVMAATGDWSSTDFMEFHALVKRLGQTICTAYRPKCPVCPIRDGCRLARNSGARLEEAVLLRGLSPDRGRRPRR